MTYFRNVNKTFSLWLRHTQADGALLTEESGGGPNDYINLVNVGAVLFLSNHRTRRSGIHPSHCCCVCLILICLFSQFVSFCHIHSNPRVAPAIWAVKTHAPDPDRGAALRPALSQALDSTHEHHSHCPARPALGSPLPRQLLPAAACSKPGCVAPTAGPRNWRHRPDGDCQGGVQHVRVLPHAARVPGAAAPRHRGGRQVWRAVPGHVVLPARGRQEWLRHAAPLRARTVHAGAWRAARCLEHCFW
jgi:hypothetical protein